MFNFNFQVPHIPFWVLPAAMLFPIFMVAVDKLFFEQNPEGCRQIGRELESHMADQYDKKYAKSDDETRWRVKAVFIYPIKSCCGLEMNRIPVEAAGLRFDRRLCFARQVKVENEKEEPERDSQYEWRFMTQRQFPKLALVKPQIWVADPNKMDYDLNQGYVKAGGCYHIEFPDPSPGPFNLWRLLHAVVSTIAPRNRSCEPTITFRIPLEIREELMKGYELSVEPVKIWGDTPEALNLFNLLNHKKIDKLREFLGVKDKITMFRVHPEKERQIFKNAPKKEDLGYQPIQGFTDAYPLHFTNLASIHDVSSRLPRGFGKLSALRFRSNFYITGPEAYDEDDWTRVQIGKHEYIVTNRTTRCPLPNVDPDFGEPAKYGTVGFNEPLKTLKSYRCIDDGAPEAPCLGMQMVPVQKEGGMIAADDEIEVKQRGEHKKIK